MTKKPDWDRGKDGGREEGKRKGRKAWEAEIGRSKRNGVKSTKRDHLCLDVSMDQDSPLS